MTTTPRMLDPGVTAQHSLSTTGARLRTEEIWRLAGVSVVWLTSLLVVAVWVAGGGVQGVIGAGGGVGPRGWPAPDAMTSLGRLCGLVASNLLLHQVLLMARVPLFERAFGHDALTRAHRLTGFWSFWLMLAHVVLVVVGYAGAADRGLLAELWTMVVSFEDMVPAALGTLALIGVVVLSLQRARRRVRYETWHLLHLYAYAGIFLALPHQLSTGADFVSSPLATAYWWGLWVLAAGCTVVFRLAVPLRRSLHHRLSVQSVTPDGTRGVTVLMEGRDLEALGLQAGQFFIWNFLDGRGLAVGHPFSVSARPDPTHLAVTVRVVGDGTRRIAAVEPGTRVLIEGPYGYMTPRVRRGRHLLMIGAGAGVAPLVSLLQELPYARGEATLITRETRAEESLLVGTIQTLVSGRGLTHVALVGPRARTGSSWLSRSMEMVEGAQYLRAHIPSSRDCDVYMCGPGPWMDAVRADLDRAGVSRERIHFENFGI